MRGSKFAHGRVPVGMVDGTVSMKFGVNMGPDWVVGSAARGTMKSANLPRHCATNSPEFEGLPAFVTRMHRLPLAHPVVFEGAGAAPATLARKPRIATAGSCEFI